MERFRLVGLLFKERGSTTVISMLRIALLFICIWLSTAMDLQTYSTVSSSSDLHPRKSLSLRRCTSLASELSLSCDFKGAAADSRSSTVYNAVHTTTPETASRPLTKSIERFHRQLSSSRFCSSQFGDSVYTELQTQLYPEIRF